MSAPPKIPIFILSNDDLTSNLIFAPLFDSPLVDIRGVAFTETLSGKQGGLFGTFKLLRKMDARYWLYLVFTNGFFKVFEKLPGSHQGRMSVLKSLRQLCRQHHVPIYTSANFNSEPFLSIVRQAQPALLLIRVNQILKQAILDIPSGGTWCVHSSLLPAYRGIAAEFHGMAHQERYLGTSVFEVRLKLDEGPVLQQCAFPRDPNVSLFSNMLRNNLEAARLLKTMVETYAATGQIQPQVLNQEDRASYYSWPTRDDLTHFFARGNTLITVSECLRFVLACLKVRAFRMSESVRRLASVPVES